jgi:hypothetical protein
MPPFELHSSVLRTAAYQERLALLVLEFHSGEVYHYSDVPAEAYEGLLQAASQGAYFNRHIRNCFACAKLHPERPPAFRDSDTGGDERRLTL